MYFEDAIVRIREYIKDKNIDAVLLGRRSSFGWFCGGENSMNFYTDMGLAFIWVSKDEAFVFCANNEKDRVEREVFDKKFPVKDFSWVEGPLPNLAKLIGDKKVHSDFPCGNAVESFGAIKKLRYSLLPEQISVARDLSRRSALILEGVMEKLTNGMSEKQIQAEVYYAFGKENISLPVLLIAGDDNLNLYRHPLPTNAICNHRVMIVICSWYRGVVISATRIRYFRTETSEENAKNIAICKINAQMIAGSKKGTHAKELWQNMLDSYKTHGYENEYLNHHQGGGAGFESREWILRPNVDETILGNQLMAWNPTLVGTKSEETAFVTDSGNIEILTTTGNWPIVEQSGISVTGVLV